MSTDLLHRFSFTDAPIRGQWVRLDEVLREICTQQPYPAVVRRLLGQMLAAVAMFEGDQEAARQYVEQFHELTPPYGLSFLKFALGYVADQDYVARYLDALREARNLAS